MKKCLILLTIVFLGSVVLAAGDEGRKTGTLKIATPGLIVKVLGGKSRVTGKREEVPVPPGREVTLPVAKYEVAGVVLCAQDAAKTVWSLESSGDLGKLKGFEIAEGQTVTLEGGAPLQVKTAVTISAGAPPPAGVAMAAAAGAACPPGGNIGAGAVQPLIGGKTVTVLLSYVGQAGEVYSPRVKKGQAPAGTPMVRIVDYEKGVMAEGPYKFGATIAGMG